MAWHTRVCFPKQYNIVFWSTSEYYNALGDYFARLEKLWRVFFLINTYICMYMYSVCIQRVHLWNLIKVTRSTNFAFLKEIMVFNIRIKESFKLEKVHHNTLYFICDNWKEWSSWMKHKKHFWCNNCSEIEGRERNYQSEGLSNIFFQCFWKK